MEEPRYVPALRIRALTRFYDPVVAFTVREGEFKRHYTLVSEVLRKYMSTTEPKWSTDLTTDELAQRTKDVTDTKPAISVLRQSDMVKFARSIPDAQTAERDLERTSDWITQYPAPAPTPATTPAEGKAA